MALTPMDITARVRGLDTTDPSATTHVRGQVQIATTDGEIVSVALDPERPAACPEAIAAILEADWVVLGPGSWFTSVIPHLMVPELREALERTTARLVVVLNLEPQAGETHGYGPEDHLGALFEHAPDLRVHAVLAERRTVTDVETLDAAVASAGAHLVLADLAELGPGEQVTARHDPELLAAAYRAIFEAVLEV